VRSLPSPEAHELAPLLVQKAEGDESLRDRLLGDHDVPDDVLGFHVQQAVEKRLKAVLALNEVEYEHTHSVSYLTALIEKEGIDLPGCREEIEGLTPWAVAARYDGTFEKVLDRAAARTLVSEMRDWSRRLATERQVSPPQVEAGQTDDEEASAASG
jgi:HEPN domain-containing protein